MQSRSRGIGTRLAALVLVAVLPFVLLHAWHLYADAARSAQHARRQVFGLAQIASVAMADFVADARRILEGLAELPAVRALDPSRCAPLMQNFPAIAPRFSDLYILDADGRLVCAVVTGNPSRPGREPPTPDLLRALATGRFTIGRPVQDPGDGEWRLAFAQPLRDGQGRAIGVVALSIDLLKLPMLPAVEGLSTRAVVGLIDSAGTVIARSLQPERFVGTNYRDQPAARAVLRERSGTDESPGLDGILRVRGFTPVPGTDWIALASLPSDEVYAGLRQQFVVSVVLALLIMAGAALFALRLARQIRSPIAALAAAANEVAGGNLAARVPLTGTIEIEGVARQFNRMVEARQTAESALRVSEERLRVFIHYAPSAIAMFDREMRYLACSRRWVTDYGLAEQDIVGRSHYELFPDLPEHWKDVHRRCLAGSIERADADPFPRADGSCEWVHWITHPWRTDDGGIGGIIIFSEVITARVRAEEALRESGAQLRRIMDNMYPFVGLLSLDGRVLEVNRTALEVAGLNRDEVIGQPCADMVWFNYSTAAQERLRAALARAGSGEVVRYDEAIQVSGGQFVDIDVMFSPLRDADGCVRQIVGSATDITARKAAESERQAYAEERHRLSRRVMEIAETERRAISRELHDRIGQNLATLNLNLRLVRARVAKRAPADVLARIDAAQQLIEATTREARDLMAELNPPALEDFGLLAALRVHVDALASHGGTRIAVTGEEYDPRLPPPVELAFFRIAQEALANAAKHSRASAVKITLAPSPAGVVLTIADDGRGFDAGGAARQAGGWGLKIMRERATAAGATLRIDSAPGRGTSVTVEFARDTA